MRAVLTTLVLLSFMSAAAPSRAQKAEEEERAVEWIRRPTVEEMNAVYPLAALRGNIEGRAVLQCDVRSAGLLEKCRVVEEAPAGMGFGDAALLASSGFLVRPTKEGGGTIRVPVRFERPQTTTIGGAQETIVRNPRWAQVPAPSQIDAVFPEDARAESFGRVSYRCEINARGELHQCVDGVVEPKGKGFVTAGRRLLPLFRAGDQTGPGDLRGNYVYLAIHFTNPAMRGSEPRQLADPIWVAMPTAEQLVALFPKPALASAVKSGKASVNCIVSAEGAMEQCALDREDPINLGFGAAALEAARYMKVNLWTESGLPTAGMRARLPFRFNIEDVAPSAAQ